MREGFAPEKIDFNVRGLSFRALIRLCLFILQATVFLFSHSLILFLVPEKFRLKLILVSNTWHARLILRYLGIEVTYERQASEVKGKLIVCNHLSYVDVLVLFAHYPSLFITSTDIGKIFFLGHITRMAGCFFVERNKELRSPETTLLELEEMKLRLSEGFNVFLFPEGTSSDGTLVLPFKAHFFQLATTGNIPVQPLTLKYHGSSRKSVPWYGDMEFLPHFLALANEKKISVSLNQHPVINPEGKDHFELKEITFQKIRISYDEN